jgi:hypothetical protein
MFILDFFRTALLCMQSVSTEMMHLHISMLLTGYAGWKFLPSPDSLAMSIFALSWTSCFGIHAFERIACKIKKPLVSETQEDRGREKQI